MNPLTESFTKKILALVEILNALYKSGVLYILENVAPRFVEKLLMTIDADKVARQFALIGPAVDDFYEELRVRWGTDKTAMSIDEVKKNLTYLGIASRNSTGMVTMALILASWNANFHRRADGNPKRPSEIRLASPPAQYNALFALIQCKCMYIQKSAL